MEWWIWVVAALVFLGLEVATGTFYVMFFAVGALIVGILRAVGLADPLWLQLLLFASLSVATVVFFRKPLFDRIRGGDAHQAVDDIKREPTTAIDAIPPNAGGKAVLRGVPWNARNVGDRAIEAGSACVIEKVEGLTLLVRAG